MKNERFESNQIVEEEKGRGREEEGEKKKESRREKNSHTLESHYKIKPRIEVGNFFNCKC